MGRRRAAVAGGYRRRNYRSKVSIYKRELRSLMIRAFARFLVKGIRRLAEEPASAAIEQSETAMLVRFAPAIVRYRERGARIADNVRLLGELDGVNPHLISIGEFSVIGKGSILLTHCPINGAQPVSIGNFVYIGFGAIVLPGVTLGDHCIVGAGAVVTKSAPKGSVLAGNPARILREVTAEESAHIEDVLRRGKMFGWDSNRPPENQA
jgi:acetyltransferase-like isoleucine patch superfamily enzyme